MDPYSAQLYREIKRHRLHWRYPKKFGRILRRIEKGRLSPSQAQRWLRKIKPWIEEDEKCPNPFPPAPDQQTLGDFDIEIGSLKERSDNVRVGVRIMDRPRHVLVAGTTGAGKTNILRRIFIGLNTINRNDGRIHSDPRP
jgi:type IV secretory pathway ATPase VirB11/archaellum biosynthesis ATPase